MKRVWLLSAALADIEAARQWYEAQRPGLGAEFVDAVDDAMESVLAFPAAYPVDYRDARRFLIERFPYFSVSTENLKEPFQVALQLHEARKRKRT